MVDFGLKDFKGGIAVVMRSPFDIASVCVSFNDGSSSTARVGSITMSLSVDSNRLLSFLRLVS